MGSFIDAAIGFPTAVFTGLLGIVLIYWLLAIIGLVDFEAHGLDVDVDVQAAEGEDDAAAHRVAVERRVGEGLRRCARLLEHQNAGSLVTRGACGTEGGVTRSDDQYVDGPLGKGLVGHWLLPRQWHGNAGRHQHAEVYKA